MSGGSKLTKITDGAVSFDGTNDSLSVADHADFTFGSGDFTIAMWWRYTGSNFNGTPYLLDMRGSGNVIVIYAISSNKHEVFVNGNQWNTGSETLTVNNWHHTVYCRVGTTRYLYVNFLQKRMVKYYDVRKELYLKNWKN